MCIQRAFLFYVLKDVFGFFISNCSYIDIILTAFVKTEMRFYFDKIYGMFFEYSHTNKRHMSSVFLK